MAHTISPIKFAIEPDLTPEEFIAVLAASGLAQRRPVGDRDRIQRMLKHGSIIATARSSGRLVGVARSITDYAFCVYLSDLAVDRAHQGSGVGRELIRLSHAKAGTDVTGLVLLAAPEAETYYRHIELEQFPQCFIIRRQT